MERVFEFKGGRLTLDRPRIVGILNLTPDSFSDGGKLDTPEKAIRAAEELIAQGADILDFGAESTRPGYIPITAEEELSRLLPVLSLAKNISIPLSVDTLKAQTAQAAMNNGASILNTVCDINENPQLAAVAAENGAGLIITHNRLIQGDTQQDILHYFETALELCLRYNLNPSRICLDVGIGFAKNTAQSIAAVCAVPKVREFGCAVMLAHSRKRFIGELFEISDPTQRDTATAAISALAASLGADFLRVHNVSATARTLKLLKG